MEQEKDIEFEELRRIIEKVVAGDESAILRVIEMFMPKIVASSFVRDKFDEDLKQEIIIKLYKNLKKFKINKNI